MDENLHKQMVFDAKRKSIGVAYLLWFFLAGFGAHRFYAGKKGTGIAQMLLLFSVIGWLVLVPWLLIDLVLIPGMINDKNMETINELNRDARGVRSSVRPTEPEQPARRIEADLDPKREAMLEELRKTGYKRERRDNSHVYR
jgi:TM2 domain-containing membrane protein YozV